MKQYRLYLLLILTGASGAIAATQLTSLPSWVKVDQRLSSEYSGWVGVPKQTFLSKLPITPPSLNLGFDRPSSEAGALLLQKSTYRVAAPFHSMRIPLNTWEEVWKTESSAIMTDDLLFFGRYSAESSRLEFVKDPTVLMTRLQNDPESLAVLNLNSIPPTVRTISPSFDVSVWAGWKKSPSRVAEHFGLNNELDVMVENMRKRARIEPDSPITTIVAVGDIMLARGIGKKLKQRITAAPESSYPFEQTEKTLKEADIAVGNLECAISNKGAAMPGKDYTFRADPNAVNQLVKAGFDIVSLGNNHSNDYGPLALVDTLARLTQAGIASIGAGRTRKEAAELKILTTSDGTKVGFLGYTAVLPRHFLADSKNPGVAWAKDKRIFKEIEAARPLCDVLVLQYHWGVEYTMNPTQAQRDLARKSIDLGADLVIGHHPHWVQEVEFYKDKFIAYSLGNFVFDMNHRPKVTEGLILTCSLRNKKLFQVHCDPVSLKTGQPEIIAWDNVTKTRKRQEILTEIYAASGLIPPSDHRLALAK